MHALCTAANASSMCVPFCGEVCIRRQCGILLIVLENHTYLAVSEGGLCRLDYCPTYPPTHMTIPPPYVTHLHITIPPPYIPTYTHHYPTSLHTHLHITIPPPYVTHLHTSLSHLPTYPPTHIIPTYPPTHIIPTYPPTHISIPPPYIPTYTHLYPTSLHTHLHTSLSHLSSLVCVCECVQKWGSSV